MSFDFAGVVKKAAGGLADAGMHQTQEAINELNLVLGLLVDAGYEVGQIDIELAIQPKITVNLKLSKPVNEEKLNAILRDHSDKTAIIGLVTLLLRANQLRGEIKVEDLGLAEIKVVVSAAPQLVMSWKEAAAAA